MSELERKNKIEVKINNMENNIKVLNKKLTILNQNIGQLSSIIDKLNILLNNKNKQISLNNSKNSMELSEFADEQGSLNNIKNPFIIESKKYKKNFSRYPKKKIESVDSSINHNKRIKDPLYYYYTINSKTYKYTCKKNQENIV